MVCGCVGVVCLRLCAGWGWFCHCARVRIWRPNVRYGILRELICLPFVLGIICAWHGLRQNSSDRKPLILICWARWHVVKRTVFWSVGHVNVANIQLYCMNCARHMRQTYDRLAYVCSVCKYALRTETGTHAFVHFTVEFLSPTDSTRDWCSAPG